MEGDRKRLGSYVAVGCGLGMMGILVYFLHYVWGRVFNGVHLGDFGHFYAAAEAIREGVNPYQVIAPGFDHPGYIYPPLIAFLYVPLTYMGSVVTAARVSLVVNILAFAVSLLLGAKVMLERFGVDVRMREHRGKVVVVAFLALLLSLDKAKGELQMLQTNMLILMALVVGLWLLDKTSLGVGAALGFAINIKYQALVMLPYLLVRRRWKEAGATVGFTGLFAFLPGVLVGFGRETEYLSMAFGGVLKLVGIHVGGGMDGVTATIENIGVGFSVSVTSAVARMLAREGSTMSPMVVAGGIGVLWLLWLGVLYVWAGVPVLRWPSGEGQGVGPWKGWVGIEWMVVVVTVLCFSPQTNTRHLVLMTLVDVGAFGLVAVHFRNGRMVWPVVAGVVLIWAGLNLPPGRRVAVVKGTTTEDVKMAGEEASPEVKFWHGIGGPSWMMLAGMSMIAFAGLRLVKRGGGMEDEVGGTHEEVIV